jgi:hypothetical protein
MSNELAPVSNRPLTLELPLDPAELDRRAIDGERHLAPDAVPLPA